MENNMENMENILRQNGNLSQNREERIYRVKLENAQIVVIQLGEEIVLLQNRKNWNAYFLNDDKLEEINPRLVPFLLRLVEISEELREIEKMLEDEE
jgi:hypothetical protein